MSIEFPDDLSPITLPLTGDEYILADKKKVTINDVAEFFLSSDKLFAAPLPQLTWVTNFGAQDVQLLNGTVVKVGPAVTISGSVSYKIEGQNYGEFYAELAGSFVPPPVSTSSIPGVLDLRNNTHGGTYGGFEIYVGPTTYALMFSISKQSSHLPETAGFSISYIGRGVM